MSIFTQVEHAVDDYSILWAAFRESAQQAADITAAVAARIAADRAQADERTTTLAAQSRDPTRPEVVRKLAQQELERLQERVFEPTTDEAAAFADAIEDARAALKDVTTVRGQLKNLFEGANRELDTLRARTLGDQSRDIELAGRHLDREKTSFDRLWHTERPGNMP